MGYQLRNCISLLSMASSDDLVLYYSLSLLRQLEPRIVPKETKISLVPGKKYLLAYVDWVCKFLWCFIQKEAAIQEIDLVKVKISKVYDNHRQVLYWNISRKIIVAQIKSLDLRTMKNIIWEVGFFGREIFLRCGEYAFNGRIFFLRKINIGFYFIFFIVDSKFPFCEFYDLHEFQLFVLEQIKNVRVVIVEKNFTHYHYRRSIGNQMIVIITAAILPLKSFQAKYNIIIIILGKLQKKKKKKKDKQHYTQITRTNKQNIRIKHLPIFQIAVCTNTSNLAPDFLQNHKNPFVLIDEIEESRTKLNPN
ncbi:hypothetical protein HYC85_018285 [Camellia sinensis]|uniref:Uncharacterized protein n=1 Tax=Camellia sinensis TaxID=4442 RepID=A0A7J7GXS2_CAMSI|nr:hypothetical protein HYC85_018285 [Camellia sinensis]